MPTPEELNFSTNLENKLFKLEIDSLGFISPSFLNNNPNFKIIFYGGSTTECLYVDELKRFPYLVGQHLSNKNLKVNTYNGGKSGNHSMHSINRLLNDGLKQNPDAVFLMHNINDLNYLLYEGNYWSYNKKRGLIEIEEHISNYNHATFKNFIQRIIPNIYMRLFLLKNKLQKKKVSVDAFAHIRNKKIFIDNESILEKFEKSLNTFIKICKVHDVIPILATQANKITIQPEEKVLKSMERISWMNIEYDDYMMIYKEMNEKIREVSLKNNILCVDLDKLVPKDNLHIIDPVHLSKEGSIYASNIISNTIEKAVFGK